MTMLFVNGDPLCVSEGVDDLLGAVLSNRHLSQATAAFLSDPLTEVPAQRRSLCILQVRHKSMQRVHLSACMCLRASTRCG